MEKEREQTEKLTEEEKQVFYREMKRAICLELKERQLLTGEEFKQLAERNG